MGGVNGVNSQLNGRNGEWRVHSSGACLLWVEEGRSHWREGRTSWMRREEKWCNKQVSGETKRRQTEAKERGMAEKGRGRDLSERSSGSSALPLQEVRVQSWWERPTCVRVQQEEKEDSVGHQMFWVHSLSPYLPASGWLIRRSCGLRRKGGSVGVKAIGPTPLVFLFINKSDCDVAPSWNISKSTILIFRHCQPYSSWTDIFWATVRMLWLQVPETHTQTSVNNRVEHWGEPNQQWMPGWSVAQQNKRPKFFHFFSLLYSSGSFFLRGVTR